MPKPKQKIRENGKTWAELAAEEEEHAELARGMESMSITNSDVPDASVVRQPAVAA